PCRARARPAPPAHADKIILPRNPAAVGSKFAARRMSADSKEQQMQEHKHKIVSHEQWIAARKAYLAEEKAFSRARDQLARKRRELPWEKVEKNYVFDTPDGKQSLSDLFRGKSQLIIYHFMLGPDWEAGCQSC